MVRTPVHKESIRRVSYVKDTVRSRERGRVFHPTHLTPRRLKAIHTNYARSIFRRHAIMYSGPPPTDYHTELAQNMDVAHLRVRGPMIVKGTTPGSLPFVGGYMIQVSTRGVVYLVYPVHHSGHSSSGMEWRTTTGGRLSTESHIEQYT